MYTNDFRLISVYYFANCVFTEPPKEEKMEEQPESTSGQQTGHFELPQNSLTSNKPLSASQGSLRSNDNDSSATMSADEAPPTSSIGHGQHTSTVDGRDSFSPRTSGIPVSRIHQNLVHQTHIAPHQLPGSANNQGGSNMVSSSMQGISSQVRPGSAGTGVVQQSGMGQIGGQRLTPGQMQVQSQVRPASSPAVDVEMTQRPSSREIPTVKEPHGNGQGGMDLSHNKNKNYSLYNLLYTREQPSPHRPSSAQSEPGHMAPSPGLLRSLSPNVLPQQGGFGNNQIDKRSQQQQQQQQHKPACVRDLIHSAIERNLGQSNDKPEQPIPEKSKYLYISASYLSV